eukprot:scaffold95300_cov27-Phaeocystis_antarctica.AAC.1
MFAAARAALAAGQSAAEAVLYSLWPPAAEAARHHGVTPSRSDLRAPLPTVAAPPPASTCVAGALRLREDGRTLLRYLVITPHQVRYAFERTAAALEGRSGVDCTFSGSTAVLVLVTTKGNPTPNPYPTPNSNPKPQPYP